MVYLSMLIVGFLILPCSLLMSKILRLDETDTKCTLIISLPSALFCIIYAFCGWFL